MQCCVVLCPAVLCNARPGGAPQCPVTLARFILSYPGHRGHHVPVPHVAGPADSLLHPLHILAVPVRPSSSLPSFPLAVPVVHPRWRRRAVATCLGVYSERVGFYCIIFLNEFLILFSCPASWRAPHTTMSSVASCPRGGYLNIAPVQGQGPGWWPRRAAADSLSPTHVLPCAASVGHFCPPS